MTGFEGRNQGFWIERFRLDMHPATESIVGLEMSVIGCKCRQPPPLPQQLVEQIPSVSTVDFDETAMIVDLDRMGGRQRISVLDRQLRPGGMRDTDESALSGSARCQLGTCFIWRRRLEIKG